MRSARRHAGSFLVAAGMGLIIAGGGLIYPYVHSRLVAPGPVTTPGATSGQATVVTRAHEQPREVSPADATSPSPTHEPQGSTASSRVLVAPKITESTAESSESSDQDSASAPPTRIVIPGIGLDAPVVPVSWEETQVSGETHAAWDVPDDYAAGWHKTSARLGEPGNTVLNGHNTSHGEVFRSLYTLEIGERVLLYSHEISQTYLVSQTMVLPEAGQPLDVRVKNAQYVLPASDERLTLVTCHPYGSLRNRLIVIARPSEHETALEPPEDP